ncbi:MAG: hypothetical protein QM648_09815 [Solirubrobacterales bacterium]
MFRRAILPVLLIAGFATFPALSSHSGFQYTHSETIKIDRSKGPHADAVDDITTSLPQTWCGSKVTADQTVNSTGNENPKFKFIYAHAADQPDRFDVAANAIQRSVAIMHEFMLAESSGTRTVSVDFGTSCGGNYVDIQDMTLPGNLSSYLDAEGYVKDEDVANALINIAKFQSKLPRHYVFLLDQFDPSDSMHGIGLQALDDSAGAGNHNNDSNAVAFVATPEGELDSFVEAYLPRMFLHEMTHTMGGVQNSAPNSSLAGHCIDGKDVMCYKDGGARENLYTSSVCNPEVKFGMDESYDCNKNDYFNTAPAAGSYLATHWNVFNSIYLVKCAVADPLCIAAPSSEPSPDNPAARTAINALYLYKKSKRSKQVGTVSASGAIVAGSKLVRNAVGLSKIKLPKGKWKVTVCFRESGEPSVCSSSTRSTSSSGYLKTGTVYVNTNRSDNAAWGSVSIKPVTKSLKKKKYEVRTTKSIVTYQLDF